MSIEIFLKETSQYEEATSEHRAGSISKTTLKRIFEIVGFDLQATLETGCGKSTIFFSNFSHNHYAFCIDDREKSHSAVSYFLDCPASKTNNVHFVFGPTQKTLPMYNFDMELDVILLDGPHGYPFPDLEYYYTYPHLRKGGFIVIDDLQIASVGRMADILAEDKMYEYTELIERKTLVLRRTDSPMIDPYSDSWNSQAYNLRRLYGNPQTHLVDGKLRTSFLDLYTPKEKMNK